MGLLDMLLQNAPAIVGELAKNSKVVEAALSLLSSQKGSVGGPGGLAGLATAFQEKGLGDMMSSWIAKGPNPPVSGSQLQDVLSSGVLDQFAQKAGVAPGNAGNVLAALLPNLVDHLTPDGQVPQADTLEQAIGALAGSLRA